jgi:hypothetical protein
MSGMTGAKMFYFICAWIVAACAVLALILIPIQFKHFGMAATGYAFQSLFIGGTGCLALLYLSGFLTNRIVFLIASIIVGVLAILSIIFVLAEGFWDGTGAAGYVFQTLSLGLFGTVLLLHLSGKLGGD